MSTFSNEYFNEIRNYYIRLLFFVELPYLMKESPSRMFVFDPLAINILCKEFPLLAEVSGSYKVRFLVNDVMKNWHKILSRLCPVCTQYFGFF